MEVQVVAYLSTPTAFVFPKRKQKNDDHMWNHSLRSKIATF